MPKRKRKRCKCAQCGKRRMCEITQVDDAQVYWCAPCYQKEEDGMVTALMSTTLGPSAAALIGKQPHRLTVSTAFAPEEEHEFDLFV